MDNTDGWSTGVLYGISLAGVHQDGHYLVKGFT